MKYITYKRASLVAQMVKNLPAMLETQFQSLGGKYPLEKGMATHSGILAWRILSITLLACEMLTNYCILWHCLSLGLE